MGASDLCRSDDERVAAKEAAAAEDAAARATVIARSDRPSFRARGAAAGRRPFRKAAHPLQLFMLFMQ